MWGGLRSIGQRGCREYGIGESEVERDFLSFARRFATAPASRAACLCTLCCSQPLPHGICVTQYRLEMGCKAAPTWGGESSSLYDYWGSSIADEIVAALGENSGGVIVNCASTEYSKAVIPHLDGRVQLVDCVFKDDGRIKSVYAKRARGLMAVRKPSAMIVCSQKSLSQFRVFDTASHWYQSC